MWYRKHEEPGAKKKGCRWSLLYTDQSLFVIMQSLDIAQTLKQRGLHVGVMGKIIRNPFRSYIAQPLL